MPTAFVQKLQHGAALSGDDRRRLAEAVADAGEVGPHEDLIRQGQPPDAVHVVLDGFACRYKLLPDGRRQIMAWLTPGDMCDLHVAILGEMDHNIATLTRSRIAKIPTAKVAALTRESSALARAFRWATLVTRRSCASG